MPLTFTRKTSLILGGTAALALIGATIGVSTTAAQFDPAPRAQDDQRERENDMRIGTYEPQRVFQSSHHAQTLTERLGPLQQEAMQAQQEGDQQRAMEVQGQMQAIQNEVVQSFLTDVEQAIPDVAAERGVNVVALEVVWVDPDLGEPRDISQDLIAQLNEDADDNGAQQRSPFMPPGE